MDKSSIIDSIKEALKDRLIDHIGKPLTNEQVKTINKSISDVMFKEYFGIYEWNEYQKRSLVEAEPGSIGRTTVLFYRAIQRANETSNKVVFVTDNIIDFKKLQTACKELFTGDNLQIVYFEHDYYELTDYLLKLDLGKIDFVVVDLALSKLIDPYTWYDSKLI